MTYSTTVCLRTLYLCPPNFLFISPSSSLPSGYGSHRGGDLEVQAHSELSGVPAASQDNIRGQFLCVVHSITSQRHHMLIMSRKRKGSGMYMYNLRHGQHLLLLL